MINGEKWFVTTGDEADYIIVHAIVDGDPDKPTLFLVDETRRACAIKREPKFTHTYVFGHPEFVFEDVEVDAGRVLGGIGQGLELTKDWFVEARLQIAANCLGAAIRALRACQRLGHATRRQFGRAIRAFQAIEFMLADMAVEIMAAKSMIYRVAWEIDHGLDRKLAHARASALKLYASEMAGRVLDKAVQIFGGRGYMRENPVERLNRDVRVDRIWEGTSEIQRVIIGGQLAQTRHPLSSPTGRNRGASAHPLRPLSGLDLGRRDHCLGAALDAEFLQDGRDVRLHGRFRDGEVIGDLLVQQTLGEHHQHAHLLRGEVASRAIRSAVSCRCRP